MSTATALKTAATGKAENPIATFSHFLDRLKPQMELALPKHLNGDRMARLALTAFSTSPKLQQCTQQSIAASIMTAAQLGLEPGVMGQGYLIPYKQTCTFVPGWKGLCDLVNRAGRATVWTGAVFEGDPVFDYAQGDQPFIKHRQGDEDDPAKLTHVYAVGRVKGSEWPVIEVWTAAKVRKHRDKYNRVGTDHYSFRDWEMYARKVPLLQVLKYMPSSVELSAALQVSATSDTGAAGSLGKDFVFIDAETGEIGGGGEAPAQAAATTQTKSEPVAKGNKGKGASAAPTPRSFAAVSDAIQKAKDGETAALELDTARDLPPDQYEELVAVYKRTWEKK